MGPLLAFILNPIYIMLCLLVGFYWRAKGQSWLGGTVLSMLISPIGGAIVGSVLSSNQQKLAYRRTSSGQYKTCPECHSLVKKSLRLCSECHYTFGNELYEELRERLLGIDEMRFTVLNQFGKQHTIFDSRLKSYQYKMLGLPDDVLETGRQYSTPQLEGILEDFPTRSEIEQATYAQAKLLLTSIECPHCHALQPRDNLMCSECYTDLKRLNPDTGEIESVDVEWADEQK